MVLTYCSVEAKDMDKGTAYDGLRNAAAHNNGIDMEGTKVKILDVLDKMDG